MLGAMAKSDPYRRNNAVAAAHLQMNGFAGARTADWGGNTQGVEVPLETGHTLQVGQSPDGPNGEWHIAIRRSGEADTGDNLRLGELPAGVSRRLDGPVGVTHRGVPLGGADDSYTASVVSHPANIHQHVKNFLKHPQVQRAIAEDARAMRQRRPPSAGPRSGYLGGQF